MARRTDRAIGPREVSGTIRNQGKRVRTWATLVGACCLIFPLVIACPIGGASASGAPPSSQRYVALGDSVPYGHGLANPYTTAQIGLPASALSQGPSADAYPSLLASALGLSLSVRTSNCNLNGDQLAVSGAMAASANDNTGDSQCGLSKGRNVQSNEFKAADLSKDPAELVTIQAGADDFDYGGCLEWELTHELGVGLDLGTQCVENGAVTSVVAGELANVRAALTSTIEAAAP